MVLNVDDAVALFRTMFDLSIWAVGLIAIMYMLAVVRVLGQRFKNIKLLNKHR